MNVTLASSASADIVDVRFVGPNPEAAAWRQLAAMCFSSRRGYPLHNLSYMGLPKRRWRPMVQRWVNAGRYGWWTERLDTKAEWSMACLFLALQSEDESR